jgi:drug/metabolite transporter (DMT)-like permease
MGELVLGMLAAFAASTLYSLGIALQASEARQAPSDETLRLALLGALVHRSRWLLGTGLSILGFPLQLVALLLAPLVVVQPALAAGLLVLLYIADRMLGERPGRYEYACVVAIVLGVVGVALAAPPRSTTHSADKLTITLVLVGLAVASLVPYLLRAAGRSFPAITMVGAGLAFGWSGIATKLASDDLSQGHYATAAAWALSTAAASGVGVLSEMSALQARPAIQVAPVVFVTQTVVPVIAALVMLGETLGSTPLDGAPLLLSLTVLVGGAAMLARSPMLLGLTAGEPVSEDSGSTESRSAASLATIRSSPASDDGEPPSSTTITSPARIVR